MNALAAFGTNWPVEVAASHRLAERSPIRERLNHVRRSCPSNIGQDSDMNRTNYGRKFHRKTGRIFSATEFAEVTKDYLGRVFGYGSTGHKRAAQTAESTVSAARNWCEGRNGMQAHHLANLCAQSDEILAEFLEAIGRADLADAARRDAVIGEIKSLLETLEAR